MTKDTERAMAIIKPFCEELKIEVSADDKFLHLNETYIGISGNSTYATLLEFTGWLFLNEYCERFRGISVNEAGRKRIGRYYFTDEQLEALGMFDREE